MHFLYIKFLCGRAFNPTSTYLISRSRKRTWWKFWLLRTLALSQLLGPMRQRFSMTFGFFSAILASYNNHWVLKGSDKSRRLVEHDRQERGWGGRWQWRKSGGQEILCGPWKPLISMLVLPCMVLTTAGYLTSWPMASGRTSRLRAMQTWSRQTSVPPGPHSWSCSCPPCRSILSTALALAAVYQGWRCWALSRTGRVYQSAEVLLHHWLYW